MGGEKANQKKKKKKKTSGFRILLISERKPNKMKKNHSECLFFPFYPAFSDTNTYILYIYIHIVSIIYPVQYNRAYTGKAHHVTKVERERLVHGRFDLVQRSHST